MSFIDNGEPYRSISAVTAAVGLCLIGECRANIPTTEARRVAGFL